MSRVRRIHRRLLTAGVLAIAASAFAVVTAAADGSARYRLVRPPLVPMERIGASAGGGYDFDVYVRLDRPLPRLRSGAPNATLELEDKGGGEHVSTIGRKTGHCYAAPIDSSFSTSKALRHPKPGAAVTVRMYVAGKRVLRVTAHLSRELPVPGENGDAPYARKLGC